MQAMLDAGETEIAIDELRWLLDGCSDLVGAHQLLGQIALEQGDLRLARGHFGYAYDICRAAVSGKREIVLPYGVAENQSLHEAAKGLAWCLAELGKPELARDVLRQMLDWDPSDPLAVSPLLEKWRSPAGKAHD